MEHGFVRKYSVGYYLKNDTGNAYLLRVDIDRLKKKVKIKTKIFSNDEYKIIPEETISWKYVADLLLKDPTITTLLREIYFNINHSDEAVVISCDEGALIDKKTWFVVDGSPSTIEFIGNRMILSKNQPYPEGKMASSNVAISSLVIDPFDKISMRYDDFMYLLKRSYEIAKSIDNDSQTLGV